MGGKTDMVKGRIKEAVGALIDDNKLRDQGRADQAVGKVKQAAQTAVTNAKNAARKTVRAAKETSRQAVNMVKDAAKKSVARAKSATNSLRESSP
jgi:uncharacterized protein YjbJ (UPF0337 family)